MAALTLDDAVRLMLEAPGSRRLGVHFCTTHTLVEAEDQAWLREGLNADDADRRAEGRHAIGLGRSGKGPASRGVCGL